MARKIISTSKRQPKIVSTSKRPRRIDLAQAAKALGAEDTHIRESKPAGSPPALFALRQELHQRLRSTGGRRGLEGAAKRYKIPLIEGDWERLQKVATASQTESIRPTPAQVASILLHNALQDEQDVDFERVARQRKR